MYFGMYVRNDKALIPTTAKVEAGFYREIDPVEIVDARDRSAFAQALANTMGRGNPSIPTPSREEYKKPAATAVAAGFKSWAAFARGCRHFGVSERPEGWALISYSPEPGGGWTPDREPMDVLPRETPPVKIGARLFDLVSSAG